MAKEKNEIKLIPASKSKYPIVQNMARFYVYDMSEYMGWKIPENGLYECIDFKKYWETQEAFPFIIRRNREMAGFVIIDKKGSSKKIDFNVAQFFILRKFKRKGIGQEVAYRCFDTYKGTWEVMVMPKNAGAYEFWKSIISAYTGNNFEESTKRVKHLSNSPRRIFKFASRA